MRVFLAYSYAAYMLTTASLQLLSVKFYSFFSIKWVFLVSIFLFELGSLICGVAQNSLTLIIGRAVAGMGSAAIFSGALIILAHSVPLERRPMYSGFIGSMYGIASVAGPLLGGAFTDKVTWRWCFFINLPIGAVTLLVIEIFFPDPQVKRESETWSKSFRRFDPLGNLVFMPAIICLLLVMQWGGITYAWNSWRVILVFCLFGVLLIVFLFVQYWQQDFATAPLRIFLKRTVWSAAIFTFCIGAAFLSSVYYLPICFQAVKSASAVNSGVMNLPLLISNVVASIISGIAVTTFGYYTPFMLLASVIKPISYGLMTTFHPGTPHSKWIGYQVLAGFGIGFGVQQPLIAVQVVLDIADVPTGTALMVFMQVLGGALFVSVDENVFSNKLVHISSNMPLESTQQLFWEPVPLESSKLLTRQIYQGSCSHIMMPLRRLSL